MSEREWVGGYLYREKEICRLKGLGKGKARVTADMRKVKKRLKKELPESDLIY